MSSRTTSPAPSLQAETRWHLPVLLAGALVVGFIGLDRSPVTWVDEVFYAEPARMLAQTGTISSPMFAGLLGLDHHFYLQPPVAVLTQALVFVLFGFGKWQVRFPGLIEYGVCIFLIHRIMITALERTVWAQRIALAAAFLFACDAGVGKRFHSGRPDYLGVALALGSTLLLLRALRQASTSPGLFVSAGLLAGAGAMAHPSLVAVVPGAGLALLALQDRPWLGGAGWRRAALYSLGVGIPVAAWAADILQAPHVWEVQFLAHARGATEGGGSARLSELILLPLQKVAYFKAMPLGALAIVALLPFVRRVRGVGQLVLWQLLTAAGLLLSRETFVYFIVAWFYMGAALVLAALVEGSEPRLQRRWEMAVLVVVLSYAPVPLGRLAATVLQWNVLSDEGLRTVVHEHVPPGRAVLASPEAYFAVVANGDQFLHAQPLYGMRLPPSSADVATFRTTMKQLRPEYAVLETDQDPQQVLGFLGASFDKVAAYSPRQKVWGPAAMRTYDVAIWKLRFAP